VAARDKATRRAPRRRLHFGLLAREAGAENFRISSGPPREELRVGGDVDEKCERADDLGEVLLAQRDQSLDHDVVGIDGRRHETRNHSPSRSFASSRSSTPTSTRSRLLRSFRCRPVGHVFAFQRYVVQGLLAGATRRLSVRFRTFTSTPPQDVRKGNLSRVIRPRGRAGADARKHAVAEFHVVP
jgi:hypothetical protein